VPFRNRCNPEVVTPNIAKGPQFSGDAGMPGKKLAAMVGVEEVHASKRGFAPNGGYFL
jgi:hypothetical protein